MPELNPQCLHLAEFFIGNTPLGTDEHIEALAWHLQKCAEQWRADKERELDK